MCIFECLHISFTEIPLLIIALHSVKSWFPQHCAGRFSPLLFEITNWPDQQKLLRNFQMKINNINLAHLPTGWLPIQHPLDLRNVAIPNAKQISAPLSVDMMACIYVYVSHFSFFSAAAPLCHLLRQGFVCQVSTCVLHTANHNRGSNSNVRCSKRLVQNHSIPYVSLQAFVYLF